MPRPATPSKRPQLTLAQLAAYDDILTDALVDHVGLTHLAGLTPRVVGLTEHESDMVTGLLLDNNPEEPAFISPVTRR